MRLIVSRDIESNAATIRDAISESNTGTRSVTNEKYQLTGVSGLFACVVSVFPPP